MFRRTFYSATFLTLIATWFLSTTTQVNTTFFQIEQGSKLSIKGITNVTDFTCKCEELFPKIQVNINKKGNKAQFEKTALSIRAKKLDCGNKAMNSDMYQTLKADDFPNIQIELLESEITALNDNWATLQASANLTIAGVTRKESFTIQAKKNDGFQYRLKGCKSIKMTDYGMTPPRPMLGLIKVKDLITLDLDLTISILDKM